MLLDPSLDLPDPNTLEEHGSRSGNVEAPMTDAAFCSNNLDKDDSPTKKSPGLDKAGSIMRSFMGTLSRASKGGNEPGHGGIERVIKDQGEARFCCRVIYRHLFARHCCCPFPQHSNTRQ